MLTPTNRSRILSFQTFPEFSSQWSSQNYVWDFWNFENWNFNYFFFSFSLTWDPIGVKISKRCYYKSQPKAFNLFLNFVPNRSSQNYLGFLKFWKLKFNEFVALLASSRGNIVWGWFCPTVFVVLQPNFFSKFPETGLTKVAYRSLKIQILFLKKKWLKFLLTINKDPMGVQFQKATAPTVMNLFEPNFLRISLWQSPQKEFWNFEFKIFKKDWNFVANGKMKNCQYLGNGPS